MNVQVEGVDPVGGSPDVQVEVDLAAVPCQLCAEEFKPQDAVVWGLMFEGDRVSGAMHGKCVLSYVKEMVQPAAAPRPSYPL